MERKAGDADKGATKAKDKSEFEKEDRRGGRCLIQVVRRVSDVLLLVFGDSEKRGVVGRIV